MPIFVSKDFILKLLTNIASLAIHKWRDLLAQSPFASPFQTPEFYDFYNAIEGQRADVFALEVDGAYLAFVLVCVQKEQGIKAYFSRRAIVYGGLLLHPQVTNAHLTPFLEHIVAHYRRQIIYLEIRNNFDYAKYRSSFQKAHFDYLPWLNFKVNIPSLNAFRQGMSKSRQRQVRKAQSLGTSWREAFSEQDLKAFYAILHDLYQRKVHKPLPSYAFFKALQASDFACCLLVEKDQEIIGGVMCLIDKASCLYEFYICGQDKLYPQHHPSIMAMWAMADYATQKAIPTLDLMGAGAADKASSVRNFKAKFGGKLVEHGRFLMISRPLLYKLGKSYLKFISFLKSLF